MRDAYKLECSAVEENCTYTAETHHIIATRKQKLGTRLQIVPAVIAAVLGVLAGTNVLTPWTIWFSVIAAAISAIGNVLNPFAEYYAHLNAAKSFTILKQDARALRDTFSGTMNDEVFCAATQSLHDRYDDLVRLAPPTDNKVFEEARRRVRAGIHKLDGRI